MAIEITEDGRFRSSDWMRIGEINGQAIYGMHVAYDELGSPRCRFAMLAEARTTYTLSFNARGIPVYTAEAEPGRPSYEPAVHTAEDIRNLPAQHEVRQGWRIVPRCLADGRPGVAKLGGSIQSPNRPPLPDFADPADVAALDEIVRAFRASLPKCPPPVDLYRACEGDNPALMRTE